MPAACCLQIVKGFGIRGKCGGGGGDVNLNLHFGGATAIVPLLYGGCVSSWAQGDGFVQLVSSVYVDQAVVAAKMRQTPETPLAQLLLAVAISGCLKFRRSHR